MLNEVFPRKMTKTKNYSFMWCSLRYLLGLVTKTFQNGSKLGLIKHDLTDEKSHTSGATSNKIEGSIHSPSFSSSSSKTRFMVSLLQYFTSLQHEQIKPGSTFTHGAGATPNGCACAAKLFFRFHCFHL